MYCSHCCLFLFLFFVFCCFVVCRIWNSKHSPHILGKNCEHSLAHHVFCLEYPQVCWIHVFFFHFNYKTPGNSTNPFFQEKDDVILALQSPSRFWCMLVLHFSNNVLRIQKEWGACFWNNSRVDMLFLTLWDLKAAKCTCVQASSPLREKGGLGGTNKGFLKKNTAWKRQRFCWVN